MKIITTRSLNSAIYQDSLKIRQKVFVQEQHVPNDLEIDEHESDCCYYVLYNENLPLATARTYVTSDGGWHIQRVAVLQPYRQQGYARKMLNYIEQQALKQQIPYLVLGAQDQAQGFYLKLGFKVNGTQYLDAGIKHHEMIKSLPK